MTIQLSSSAMASIPSTTSKIITTTTTTTTTTTKNQRNNNTRGRCSKWQNGGVLVLALLLSSCQWQQIDAAISCSSDADCETMIRPGSKCNKDNICTNPFAQGCLRAMLGNSTNANNPYNNMIRVCNSNDPPDAVEKGHCVESFWNYTEVRIHHGNWESSIFFSWVLQIFLSEILQVPVTIGLTPDDSYIASFYNDENIFSYSSAAYPFDAIEKSNEIQDCRLTDEPCAHILPEVWNGQEQAWRDGIEQEFIDSVEGNGQVGKISLYIPAFVAENDDSLVSFFGLKGEHNRQKMAETFNRPTSWKDYCELVSVDNCTTPDSVAQRYPADDGESSKYFAGDDFIGHFRPTDANNCTLNPTTCTGHIVGPPCTWSTTLESQLYWNNIALESNGPNQPTGSYSYSQMIQTWRAAEATNSSIIMWWYRPDPTVEEFRGTRAEFQPILLPEATETCAKHRITSADRCDPDIWVRRGDKRGSCDSEAHALQKILSASLRREVQSADVAFRSPAYDALQSTKITDLAVNTMLKHWIGIGRDTYGYDPREAVCTWVSENVDFLDSFIPLGYPRIISEESSYDETFLYVAQGIAGFTILIVFIAARYTFVFRKKIVFVYAQIYFAFPILFGFFLRTVAAVLIVFEPTLLSCVATQWFSALGYTFALVPLLVKIAAINKILQSARKMKRAKVSPNTMAAAVVSVIVLIAVYLLVWTIVDPQTRVEERVLVEEDGQLVAASLRCSSKSDLWLFIARGWEATLLVCASVLAFQSRNVVQEFNESQSLGLLSYSHFLFMALRVIVQFLPNETLEPNVRSGMLSFLLSIDSLIALGIYFIPKFRAATKPNQISRGRRSRRTLHHTRDFADAAAVTRAASRASAHSEDFDYSDHFRRSTHHNSFSSFGGLGVSSVRSSMSDKGRNHPRVSLFNGSGSMELPNNPKVHAVATMARMDYRSNASFVLSEIDEEHSEKFQDLNDTNGDASSNPPQQSKKRSIRPESVPQNTDLSDVSGHSFASESSHDKEDYANKKNSGVKKTVVTATKPTPLALIDYKAALAAVASKSSRAMQESCVDEEEQEAKDTNSDYETLKDGTTCDDVEHQQGEQIASNFKTMETSSATGMVSMPDNDVDDHENSNGAESEQSLIPSNNDPKRRLSSVGTATSATTWPASDSSSESADEKSPVPPPRSVVNAAVLTDSKQAPAMLLRTTTDDGTNFLSPTKSKAIMSPEERSLARVAASNAAASNPSSYQQRIDLDQQSTHSTLSQSSRKDALRERKRLIEESMRRLNNDSNHIV